jgi:hypothetical protein
MNTATQTKRYDRGYEDAIEGRKQRANDEFYLKGYRSGLVFVREDETEVVS